MIVVKFGGSSVANAQNIKKVVKIILDKSKDTSLLVVVSAMSGITDLLNEVGNLAKNKNLEYLKIVSQIEEKHLETISLLGIDSNENKSQIKNEIVQLKTLLDGCYLLGELTPKTQDRILSFGELLSSQILSWTLQKKENSTNFIDSRDIIKTNSNFSRAVVDFKESKHRIQNILKEKHKKISVFPGFIASTVTNETTTLGRGGSDYSAAILAYAVQSQILEIWTDVSGMFTAHPKLVKQAKAIEHLSYYEAMELSHFGAKVLYPPTIQPVLDANIPILIKNTFEPEKEGTYISNETNFETQSVKGISHIENISLLTLEGSGMVGVSGVAKRLFETLSQNDINVIFITQASSEHSICIGIINEDAEKAKNCIDRAFEIEILQHKVTPCLVEKNLCIVALVGEKMKNQEGLSGKMFSTLGKNNINIRAIAQGASERNISIVINKNDVKKALNSLHETFFEGNTKQLNLFIIGTGNVGEKFIDQLYQQENYLRENLKLNVRVIALSNSKKMVFNDEGIMLNQWKDELIEGEKANLDSFVEKVKNINLRNSIFIDNTADQIVAKGYEHFLKDNIAVVTCNKIACSSSQENYFHLKKLARDNNAPFLYETNVGAGLPIIDTLKNLVASGDQIKTIKAVLSGSLNFIFNHFVEANTFHEVVKEAGKQGYTEPDPKIDLSGIDVARKILILIRESGYQIEMSDIENHSFLPLECLKENSIDEFFESLEKNATHFNELLNNAKRQNGKLKYVASFENGKAKVSLECILPDSPFYHLEGKDNIVQFYTHRYADQPLIIKGAGAGAEVTASGIFADVIRIGNN